jgi:hypothetical protein
MVDETLQDLHQLLLRLLHTHVAPHKLGNPKMFVLPWVEL